MEKYYLVTIEETLSRTVKIKATSQTEAEDKVEEAYTHCDIVLNADDFDEHIIKSREVTDENLDWYEEVK